MILTLQPISKDMAHTSHKVISEGRTVGNRDCGDDTEYRVEHR